MGDLRVPALATLLAAVIAVSGSIFAVYLSGRQQRTLQRREFDEQREQRRRREAAEQERSARAAEIESCVRFDAAVVVAVAQFTRIVDLANKPLVRLRVLGLHWAREWDRQLQDRFADIAVPHAAVRLTAATSNV